MAVKKSRQFPGFLIYSQFKDSTFTAAKSNEKFQIRYLKGIPFVNWRYCVREGYLFSQKKYIERYKELDLKADFHKIKLCCGIPPPPGAQMFSIPDYRHSQKNLLSVYPKKHFSLIKSVTGDHLGFKCKNNLMESDQREYYQRELWVPTL